MERIQGDIYQIYTPTLWSIQVFYGFNKCINQMVTCVSILTKNVAFARLLGVDAPKMRKKGLFRAFSLFSFGLLYIRSLVMWFLCSCISRGEMCVCESLFHIFILGVSSNHWFCIRCERITYSSNSFEVTTNFKSFFY